MNRIPALDSQGGREARMGLREAESCFPEVPSALSSRLTVDPVSSTGDHICLLLVSLGLSSSLNLLLGKLFLRSLMSWIVASGPPQGSNRLFAAGKQYSGVKEKARRQGKPAGAGFYSRKSTEVKPQRK